MADKDLQNIESKVRDSQMKYLDYHLSPDLFTRLNQLLYLIDERKKGIAFYGLIGINYGVLFSIPDIKILSHEVAFLRSKLRDSPKRRVKRRKQPVKRMKLPELDISGDVNKQSQQQYQQGNQSNTSNNPPVWQPQPPPPSDYSKEAEKWTPAQIENWKGQLKGRMDAVANGTEEEIQAVIEEISWQNDGVIKNLTDVVSKEPTTANITAVINQIELSQRFGGNESIASEAFEAIGNAQIKRLKAAYIIYDIMKQKRYFIDLINDFTAAQLVGSTNDPVMNRIETEIKAIINSGIYK